MRVPLKWLREFVDVDVDSDELAERLSHTGSAVDKIERFAEGVGGVVVARVLDVADVPESKKLVIANVDAGPKGRVQVLAGAKNFAAGDLVPLALPGARVTTLDVPVSVRPMLKGAYESHGMLCSAKELGISDDHEGILVLPPETPLGADVTDLLGLDDVVFEFEIYPNRPDQMSVIGIAREVSVVYETPLRIPGAEVVETGASVDGLTSVTIEDPAGCPRYLARVIEGVTFHPSPLLVQARLTACGFRPLGNLVDATNYVLLMTGQPLHAFDLDKLAEERIVVRRARSGERMTTIDGEERALDEADLVIADAKGAQAIAGVMGGEASEVGPGTTRVLLESAYFDPISIARTSRRYHMRTEACARFERGADPEMVPRAAAIAAECLRQWAGGVVAAGAVDAGAAPPRRTLSLRPSRVAVVLGADVPGADRDRYLRGLGCDVAEGDGAVSVVAPSWRPDLEREIDLIEELARLHGYERFESEHRTGIRGGRTVTQLLRGRVREALIGAGLNEAMTPSFVHESDLAAVGYQGLPVLVANPMTEDQRRMRPLLMPGLLRAAQRNVAHGVPDVRLFEMGVVFTGWDEGADLPNESERVAMLLCGEAGEPHWSAKRRAVDVFDVRGIVERLLGELGIESFDVRPWGEMPFHPGRSSEVLLDGEVVGRFGELRPTVARSFDIDGPVVVGGLFTAPLFARARTSLQIAPLPTQPPVLRDIAMSLPDDVAASDVMGAIRDAGGALLESVALADVYTGAQVGEGRRSLAFRLVFRAADRTLQAAEADTVREAIAAACRERFGADIR
jgi:phenylalanyl-tRNA synthetase beta chain